MRRWLLIPLILLFTFPIGSQDYGSNWRLRYYDSTDLSGDVIAEETVDRIDLNFGDDDPDVPEGVDGDRFSMRADTQETFAEGTYRFRLGSDDGVRFFIDGVLVIDAFVAREYQEDSNSADVALNEGTYTLEVEYFQDGGGARVRLNWERIADSGPNDPAEPTAIPATPEPTAIPQPEGQVALGQVVNAEGLTVRSGPYLGGSRLAIIEPGEEFPIFARNEAEGLYTWYLIQVQRYLEVVDDISGETIRQPVGNPTVGWVSGRYFVPDTANANIPIQTTIFEQIGNPAGTGVQGILRSNMRLREGPSYRTPTLQILDWGAEVEIVGRTTQAREPHWFQVIYEGQVGWLFAPFIGVNGNLNNVPEY